ncbi:MAG: acetylornithine carbamoyltransferase, partial [Flavobacteriales bacterium]|nr:acetylornithine carbamoyltransferase [Flavobacteriales bacterium]
SLADLITIKEHQQSTKPKVVLSWAPHPKPLPHAVANSFIEWMKDEVNLIITHPEGYELSSSFQAGQVIYDQDEALAQADFVYVKNWSCYSNYGQVISGLDDWTVTAEKMKLTNQGKFMHCLPIRRNVIATDDVIDSTNSLILEQANNRTYAAQAVLMQLLSHEN